MRALALAVVVAGCGGKPAPASSSPPDNTAPDRDAHAPVYAALFERGTSWTFDVEYVHSDYDEHDEYVDRVVKLVLSCHVDTAAQHDDLAESEIVCDPDWPTTGGQVPIGGAWTMCPRGLWNGELVDAPMIAHPPAAWERAEHDPDTGDLLEESSLSERGDAWCWSTQSMQGDSYWQRLCLGPDGPTEGGYGWSGGAEYATTFTLATNPAESE